ncbi:MAG: hypothetical protein KC561_15220, partial [Myxococcales bacterium]|nr:hypothetical protein [Myxococcales bacterium]
MLGLVGLVACTSEPESSGPSQEQPTDVLSDGGTDSSLDQRQDTSSGDGGGEQDAVEDQRAPSENLGFGESCNDNYDCASGFCVAGRRGFFCTQECFDSCPDLDGEDTECRIVTNFGADEVGICVPSRESICEPCLSDVNCVEGACVQLPNSGGQVCGRNCTDTDDCPTGTFCFTEVPGIGRLDVGQCLPNNLTCDCSESTRGDTRACANSNDSGNRTCVGRETCDPSRGWIGCNAPEPAVEICNGLDDDCNDVVDDGVLVGEVCEVSAQGFESTCPGVTACEGADGIVCVGDPPEPETCDRIDNDCNGTVDDPYTIDGVYLTDENCGACGNNCADRYPDNYVTACDLVSDTPTCVVVTCPEGFIKQGDFACVPQESALCLSCATALDCNDDVGDECVDYGDGTSFCGRDCGVDSSFGTACPDGYTCDSELEQCVRTEGTCLCEPGDSFALSCVIPRPGGGAACIGTRQCDDGTLDACAPPEEVCDEFDNNCDGVVDEPFTEDGEYSTVAHCGRCFNDCDALFDAGSHASGACVESGDSYSCAPACEGGFVDVDGLIFNGCECEMLETSDYPDVDGIDSNCDGIDGEVSRGVFVATTGSDAIGDGTINNPFATISRALQT